MTFSNPWIFWTICLAYGLLLGFALRMLPDTPQAKRLKQWTAVVFVASMLVIWTGIGLRD